MRHLLVGPILPLAHSWVARQERRILREGVPLDPSQLADALSLGVADPQRVRLLRVERVPLPAGRLAEILGPLTGLFPSANAGLAARYGIFVRADHWGERFLVAHELVHTRQYEELGGIRGFLERYLHECLSNGYHAAAMEHEATNAALKLLGPSGTSRKDRKDPRRKS